MKTIGLDKYEDSWMIDENVLNGLDSTAKHLLRAPHVRDRFTPYTKGTNQSMSKEDLRGLVFYTLFSAKELGISFTQAIQGISIIKGRPAMTAELMLALVYRSNLMTSFSEVLSGSLNDKDAKYTCIVQRGTLEKVTRSFSIEDAKRAGLWIYDKATAPNIPWKTYPLRMLQMRARTTALRDAFPDIVKGFTSEEEARDIPSEPKDITPDKKVLELEHQVDQEPVVERKTTVAIYDSKTFEGEQYIIDSDGSCHLSSGLVYTKLDLADMTSMNAVEKQRMYDRKLSSVSTETNKFPKDLGVSNNENVTVA